MAHVLPTNAHRRFHARMVKYVLADAVSIVAITLFVELVLPASHILDVVYVNRILLEALNYFVCRVSI